MTDTLHRTGYNYKPDHRTYGGEIKLADFDGYSSIIDKIRDAESFDKKCMENIKSRNRVKGFKRGHR
jgi:hypothetical protein